MFVAALPEPIDDFHGLIPLHHYLRASRGSGSTRWALAAVLALTDSGLGWEGDMRHTPLVGHLPTPPETTAYLVIKQDNNGDTFIISEHPLTWLEHHYQARITEVPTRNIGGWDKQHPEPDEAPF